MAVFCRSGLWFFFVGQFLAFLGWVEGESFVFFFLTLFPEEPEVENYSAQVCPAGSLQQDPVNTLNKSLLTQQGCRLPC